MHSNFSRFCAAFLLTATVTGTAFAQPSADPGHGQRSPMVLGPATPAYGGEYWRKSEYVDFNAASSPDRDWILWSPTTTNTNLKYFSIDIWGNTSSPYYCLEFGTVAGASSPTTKDTRLWVYDINANKQPSQYVGVGGYVAISDDVQGDRHARFRIWWQKGSPSILNLYVRASGYSNLYNTMDFGFEVRRLNYPTAAECNSGAPTLNFIDSSTNPPTYYIKSGSTR
jgi:hypothetical protein